MSKTINRILKALPSMKLKLDVYFQIYTKNIRQSFNDNSGEFVCFGNKFI